MLILSWQVTNHISHAQTPINSVSVTVLDHLSTPVPNLQMSLTDTTNHNNYWEVTNSGGIATFYSIPPGQYTLKSELGSSSQLPNRGVLKNFTQTLQLNRSHPNYLNLSDSISLSPFNIQTYDKIITFQIITGSVSNLLNTAPQGGFSPLDDATINVYEQTYNPSNNRYINVTTDSSGMTVIGFDSNDSDQYQFNVTKNNYQPASFSLVPGQLSNTSYISLAPTNATLTINLKDGAGSARAINQNEYLSISCYPRSGSGGGYNSNIPQGQSSTTLPIGDGSYYCNISLNNYPNIRIDTDILAGESKSVNVTLLPVNSRLKINFSTSNNTSYQVTTANNYVNCVSSDQQYSLSKQIPINASFVEIDALAATYSCSTYIPNITSESTEITVGQNQMAQGNIIISVPDANIYVTLFDSVTFNNVTAQHANEISLSCYDNDNQRGFNKFFDEGNHSLILPVLAGRYSCNLNAAGFRSDSFSVEVSTGNTSSHSISMEELTRYIEFNLTTQTGQAFAVPELNNSYVNISCGSLPGFTKWFNASLTTNQTNARVHLVPGHYSCRISGENLYSDAVEVQVPSNDNVTLNLPVVQAKTVVNLQLVDKNGNATTTPDNTTADIYCTEAGGHYKHIIIPAQTTTVTTNMGEGTFNCSVNGSGLTSEPFLITILSNQSTLNQNVTVKKGDSRVTLALVNNDTQQPILLRSQQYGNVSCWAKDSSSSERFTARFEPNTDSTTLYLPSGLFECSTFIEGFATTNFEVTTTAGENKNITQLIFPPNSHIKVNLLTGNTSTPFSIPNGTYAHLNCRSDDRVRQGIYFGTPLNAGDSSKILPVREGTYTCSVWLPDYGSTEFTVIAIRNQTTNSTARLYSENAQLNVQIIDKDTRQLISGEALRIYAATRNRENSADTLQHYEEILTQNGMANLQLIGDRNYEISVRYDEGQTAPESRSTNRYILPSDLLYLRTSSTSPTQLTIEATKTNAFIEVRLYYPDGRPVDRGWASLTPLNEQATSQWSGGRIVAGQVTLPVVPNIPYQVSAYPEISGKTEWILQESQTVTVSENKTQPVTFTLSRPNFDLGVRVNIISPPTNATTAPSVYCYAFDAKGRQSFAEADQTLIARIPLTVGTESNSIEVSCSAYYPTTNSDIGLSYWGSASFVPPTGGATTGLIDVSVSEYGSYYAQEAYTFDAAYGASFTLQDGSTRIEIPAKAVANEGSATMYVGSATGYSFDRNAFPLLTFDIKFQVDGKLVSDMTLPVTLHFPVNENTLAKVGGLAENLKTGSFEDNTRIWREDASYTYDANLKILSVRVSHFTVWGLLVDLVKSLNTPTTITPTPTPEQNNLAPKPPTRIKIKLLTNKNKRRNGSPYKICWNAPEGVAENTSYELSILRKAPPKRKTDKRRQGNKRTLNWTKAKLINSHKTCIQTTLKIGTNYVRVRASEGEYSKVKSVKVT